MLGMSRHDMSGGGYQRHFFLTFLATRKTCLGMSPRHVRKTLLRGVSRRHVNVATYDMSLAMSLYSLADMQCKILSVDNVMYDQY